MDTLLLLRVAQSRETSDFNLEFSSAQLVRSIP
jgi:hypothetical protein